MSEPELASSSTRRTHLRVFSDWPPPHPALQATPCGRTMLPGGEAGCPRATMPARVPSNPSDAARCPQPEGTGLRNAVLAGLVLACLTGCARIRAAEWADGFDGTTAVASPWESLEAVRVDATGGFAGTAGVTAAAGRRGTIWRSVSAGVSLELRARIRVAALSEGGGAVVGLYAPAAPTRAGDPLTPAFPPTPDLTGNYVALRVVPPRGGGDAAAAQLHLTYAHPYCGQSLPFRHPSGKLALDTWYDVRMRVWPSESRFLARAWQRESGAEIWTEVADLWPGKRHVVAYEGFEPACVAVTVAGSTFVDDVGVAPVPAPPPVSLLPRQPVNAHPFTVLSFGWSTPDTKYLHDNVTAVERTPFDGTTVQVGFPRLDKGSAWNNNARDNLGWKVFSKHRLYDPRYTADLTAPAVRDLTATPFTRYRSNYLVICSYMPDPTVVTMDWFDDTWCANLAANTGLIATVAKQGGCEGILFDPEEYGCAVWSWPKLREDPLYRDRTYRETQEKVRQRGAEFARALNAGYPGIRILSIHAWDTVLRYDGTRPVGRDLFPDVGYGLLPAFLDGILEGSDERTVIVDGIETTYWVDALPDFVAKARTLKDRGAELSEVPDLFRQKVRVGFAVWLDRDHTAQPWYPVEQDKNHWTPERLAYVIGNGLAAGDGLVWVYSETATWLRDSRESTIDANVPHPGANFVPDAYRQALEDGRRRAEQLREQFGSPAESQGQ